MRLQPRPFFAGVAGAGHAPAFGLYHVCMCSAGLGQRLETPHVLYRVDISDTLMYVYEMLGAELLSSLYDKLGRLLTNTEQPSTWQVSKSGTRLLAASPMGSIRGGCSFHGARRNVNRDEKYDLLDMQALKSLLRWFFVCLPVL